jgi:starch synthase
VPTRDALFRAIAAADLYVQPSREEGLPLALVEAMALGVPVVASAINGIPEVVEHEVTGHLVPPDDPGALAGAIDALLDDPARAARLARAGRDRILPEHDLATVGATMTLLYRRALEDRAARRSEART